MGIREWFGIEAREERDSGLLPLSFDQWLSYFSFNGSSFPIMPTQTLTGNQERIGGDFESIVAQAYQGNGVVFACELARLMLFTEARFQFRRFNAGRPGDLFGDASLTVLETPWPNGTTGDLLGRMLQDADFAGNSFVARRNGGRLSRLRPDWVTIVSGSENEPQAGAWDPDSVELGIIYQPGGPTAGAEPQTFLAGTYSHFAPIPDPLSPWRGMGWVLPVIREILGDAAATAHKLKFFENGATPNMIVSLDPSITQEAYDKWVAAFNSAQEGVTNAYKTLYLGGGASAEVVGANMQQMDFKVTQGAGETRIAAAAGVPPIIVGLSEGLSSATYSNYGQARRRFADGTMRPLWRNVAGSLEAIVPPPAGSHLWYDDRDISFLQEDQKDAAEIASINASTIATLVNAGFTNESAVAAVASGDNSKLVASGLFSVQLQPPLPEGAPMDPAMVAGRALANLMAPYLGAEGGNGNG